MKDLDIAFLYQANLAITEALREKQGLLLKMVPFASNKVGNASFVAIPVLRAELK